MTKYALIIAIPEYDQLKNLEKTTHEAEKIAKMLHQYGDYNITRLPRKGNVETVEYEMKVGKVTDEDLYEELELFLTKQAQNQPALIYFTGHGFTICDRLGREKGFLATSNCKVTVKDGQIIKQENALPLEDLNYLIEQANLSELVLLLDSCHSGNYIETYLVQKSLKTFEGWQRFKQWREENRDLLRLSERLEDQRKEWLNHPIDENLMMGGLLIQIRQQWEKLQPYLLYPIEAADFYNQSDEYEKQQRQKREELEIKLQKMSLLTYLDGLTETYNRRLFQQELQKEYQLIKEELSIKENNSLLCLILGNIDYFKKYNDTYGHLQGDECLKRVVQTVEYTITFCGNNSFYCFVGEEFCIMLLNPVFFQSEKNRENAERILKAVRQLNIPHKNSPIKPYITLSLGIVTFNSNQLLESFSMQNLIMEADEALYRAKAQGGDCYVMINYE